MLLAQYPDIPPSSFTLEGRCVSCNWIDACTCSVQSMSGHFCLNVYLLDLLTNDTIYNMLDDFTNGRYIFSGWGVMYI